jgi:hypothetical protein
MTASEKVRRRVAEILRALESEDLEERVAPVKCAKHPDRSECMSDYGVIRYGVPFEEPPEEER